MPTNWPASGPRAVQFPSRQTELPAPWAVSMHMGIHIRSGTLLRPYSLASAVMPLLVAACRSKQVSRTQCEICCNNGTVVLKSKGQFGTWVIKPDTSKLLEPGEEAVTS